MSGFPKERSIPLLLTVAKTNSVSVPTLLSILTRGREIEDAEWGDLACTVLIALCSGESFTTLHEEYQNVIVAGLESDDVVFQNLAVSILEKATRTEDDLKVLITAPYFPNLIQLLASPHLRTAQHVADLLFQIASHPTGLLALLQDPILTDLQDLLTHSQTVKYRIYDLLIRISTISDATLSQIHHVGVINSLVEELRGRDVLGRLNAVQTFSEMARSEEGCQFMDRIGVIDRLLDNLINCTPDDMDVDQVLVVRAIIEFLGRLGHEKPTFFESIQSSRNVLRVLNRLMDDEFDSQRDIQDAVMDALGQIGSTIPGLNLLSTHEILSHFLSQVQSSSGDRRPAHLSHLSNLLIPSSEELTQSVWSRLSDPLKFLVSAVTSPLENYRLAGCKLFHGVVGHAWGVRMLDTHRGLRNHIVDRSEFNTLNDMVWKHKIVTTLLSTLEADQSLALDAEYVARLKEFWGQGPSYRTALHAVAVASRTG
ncbi:26S proteasome non-ATPase regulatory subunit 5 [Phlyctochytrium arcticum]|nr:26S proteasome non-ATPase regulatory subunit 5 [Phlyctochytrium arcticum]